MKAETSRVHVVFKTHLDIGFTDLAARVVYRYLKQYIPQALALARATRDQPNRFVWTTGSWLPYRFLEDADRRGRLLMEEAIAKGDFYWHALPFTTHTELLSPSLFRAGLEFSHRLDQRFGRKTLSAKMTDVPGHTIGIVPLLAEAGIRLFHIGVNPTSAVPKVPNLFRWCKEGSEVVVMYEPVYGSTTRLPGGDYLSLNLTNDNVGPPKPEEVDQLFDDLRQKHPHARVEAGNLNRVAQAVWEKREGLPVVTNEIGDTWIHGVGTDPKKVARFREMERLRSEWIKKGLLQEQGDVDFHLCEKLLLVAEHTWGMDIKTFLHDRKIWSPRQLRASLGKTNFRAVASSWREQRAYLDEALNDLPHRLRLQASRRLRGGYRLFRVSSSQRFRVGEKFALGAWEISFDSDGAISWLQKNRCQYANKTHRLASLVYRTFSAADYRRFFRQYCRLNLDWCVEDFTKPGMTGSPSSPYRPQVHSIHRSRSDDAIQVLLHYPKAARQYGAPKETILEVQAQNEGIDLRVAWKQKPANRLPEMLALNFRPCGADGRWLLEKLGAKIDVMDVVEHGGRSLHGVTGEIVSGNFSMNSLDAVLFSPGQPKLLDFTSRQPDVNRGITSILYNNIWGTNFPMWYSDAASFRYELRWKNP